MGAIYIMWLRQLKRYWRSKPRLIGSLGQPLLFLVALGFGFNHIFEQAMGQSYVDFLVPGVVAMSILFTAMFSGIELIWDRQFGFLKETLVAPVTRTQIMIGRTLGGATVAAFQGILVLLIAMAIGYRPFFATIPLALVFMFVVAFIFTAFGTAIASKMQDMQAFPLIINFIIMPLFFLSGALFPLEGIPATLDAVTRYNPLTYGVDALRFSFSGVSHFPLLLSTGVLVGAALIVFGLGTYLFTRIEI
ncbi:TPA: ABC transporter permease [Candidatus Woesearchaeota archaeon]|nr:ABC transporter permease [Candidatus Woesearchaeota archaeon]HII68794.1 ABC transporter permease [Candidatus Woesearchaeota archaeon]